MSFAPYANKSFVRQIDTYYMVVLYNHALLWRTRLLSPTSPSFSDQDITYICNYQPLATVRSSDGCVVSKLQT